MWPNTNQVEQETIALLLKNQQKRYEESKKFNEEGRKALQYGFRLPYTIEIKSETGLDCRCGSKLTEVTSIIDAFKYALFVCGPEPRVKTRAKRKIALKKYRRKFINTKLAAILIAPLRNRPSYICESCGNRMGFYQAMAESIIKVEPMPKCSDLIFYNEKSDDES
jgi:DNA-directed RNA polymerase subunit RPC12/RpoP